MLHQAPAVLRIEGVGFVAHCTPENVSCSTLGLFPPPASPYWSWWWVCPSGTSDMQIALKLLRERRLLGYCCACACFVQALVTSRWQWSVAIG